MSDFVLNFNCKLGGWNTGISEEELKSKTKERSVGELLRITYEKEAESDGASCVFVKENQTHSFARLLLSYFPGCRFVFMVRDPRDVASSWVSTLCS